jgi:uncharacterized membrane protein YkvA (DUF1232 family)
MTAMSHKHGLDRDHSRPVLPPSPVLRLLKVADEDVQPPQTRSIQMRQRLSNTVKTRAGQLWKQFRVLPRALVHPRVPWYAKAVCGCAVLYISSPIQLIPNLIPVIGQMDDVAVIVLSIKFLKRTVPADVMEECQKDTAAPRDSAAAISATVSSSSTQFTNPSLSTVNE